VLVPSHGGVSARIHRYGQEYNDLGTTVLAVAGRDLPAMLLDELLHDRKT
jgi:hypothetical protein